MFKIFYKECDFSQTSSFSLLRESEKTSVFSIKQYRVFVHKLLLMLTLSTVFFASASFAQSGSNQDVNKQDSQITLNLKDVDIRVLIDTVAEVSGKNFIVDPRVKGKVSVISGAPLLPEQLYDMFLSILEVHNFATVDQGNIIKVLPSNVIKQRPTPTLFGRTKDNNDAQITQIIQLEHASVQDLVPIIRPLIPPTSHFAPHIPSNSVVITDTTANIQRVLQIINRIDVPDERAQVRVVYLENARASELANTLTQLLVTTANPTEQNSGSTRASIQGIDSINALVVSAPDEQYTKIRALVDESDIQREVKSNVNVIYLKHADAVELVTVLTDVTANANPETGVQSEFVVQADEATNSIIVKAEPQQFASVKQIVEKLDIRRAQVYVEAVIANVSTSQMEEFGVNWDGGDPFSTSRNVLNGLGDSDLSNLNLTEGQLTYSLFNAGSDQLNLIVDAIRNDTNSNILSTPTLLTLDNETAEIVVGQEVPFTTGSFTNPADGANNAFQTIEREDVGIRLTVTPQINDGDTIQLEVEQEISSVSETQLGGTDTTLITDNSAITAIVQVDHGQVIVLGGLESDQVNDTINGVPILSRIPVLGALFRSKTKDVTRQNLMVFLKPYIIRSPEELVKYSRIRYNRTRQAELKSLKGSSKFLVPGAKPAVLDEYDSVTGEGTFGTVRTRKEEEKYNKKYQPKYDKELSDAVKTEAVEAEVIQQEIVQPEERGFQETPTTIISTPGIESGTYIPTQPSSINQ